ncbi:ROK family protein [Vagococcus elongatus]|uniref:Glucokinase n=1 Tax=Vagococcus elongatus TaxID=180344 RepID=A0A430B5Q5_9ENTE|nr:ROK family protein [Vagococcus elongatus]RSU15643.1 hypothetical protein CBF29_00790 [Vagococcus elongatus]
MKNVIGVDIGGTKIAAALVNQDGSFSHEIVIPSRVEDSEEMFLAVCEAVDKVIDRSGILNHPFSMGIGVPGLVNVEAGIAVFQNNLPWTNFPLRERLTKHYVMCETVAINNDVYQAAYAEWWHANLGKEDTLVFFTISTGVSSAIIKGGSFQKGKGFAGEVGLLPIKKIKGNQYLTLEQLASGPALAETGRLLYNDGTITAKEIFFRYRTGDPKASELVEDWTETIALGLYSVICLLDPENIILGGSVIQKNPDMLDVIQKKLNRLLIPAQKERPTKISISQMDNHAGLIGAGLSAFSSEK